MQERLLQIGRWLKVNGEGIYCSRRYCKSADEDIRYTVRDGKIYAFLMRFPFGEVTLNEVDYTSGMRAKLLGSDAEIGVENAGGKAKLVFPVINPDTLEGEHVYCFRIEK
jgi:alpha-L-fucosidase